MRRDVRLRGLSSDHHHALRLASTIQRAHRAGALDRALVGAIRDAYEHDLLPHFLVEEEVLLSALAEAGAAPLADRTRAEHRDLARLLDAAAGGDLEALACFGELLQAHVRFEERELFPTCEARLPSSVLDDVAGRTPQPRSGS